MIALQSSINWKVRIWPTNAKPHPDPSINTVSHGGQQQSLNKGSSESIHDIINNINEQT